MILNLSSSSGSANPFEQLHPALQHHIVNSLGWRQLRPLQQTAIEPLLSGEHAILLAPTAGGKTEAASFPVFSRMLSGEWQGLTVLYLCPIKALLNNLEPRLSYYAGLLGRRVALWHGDIKPGEKKRILADPPDILLTTPESLEVMLVSKQVEHELLFNNLQTTIIDEVHAFAGDDRGWHLLYLLERLQVLAGREIQRIGLSATVGNPQGLCDWLAGQCQQNRQVLNPPAEHAATPEVEVDYVGSLDNAALVISRLHRGEKRLVFCDSRARVEELALALRQREVRTFVSHSSISLEERRAAEQAFSEGHDCVIVATSTLELGIDVGDLDRVIQIDAPGSVASFLQRIGRTGRRAGTSRNCLFLATREHAFLQVLALLKLWHEDYVEPVVPPPQPWHIFAQQVMALALQNSGIGVRDWQRWLPSLPGLSGQTTDMAQGVVDHMVETTILHVDSGIAGIGDAGEKAFGRRHFMELFSVFVAPPLVKVLAGRQELGEVHQATFLSKSEEPTVLVLAGRSWRTRSVDWKRRIAYVEPTDSKGRSQWLSNGQALSFDVCQAVAAVLASNTFSVTLSRRATDMLDTLRLEYDWVEAESLLLIQRGDSVQWWTFGGKWLNTALATRLPLDSRVDNLFIEWQGVRDVNGLREAILLLIGQGDGGYQGAGKKSVGGAADRAPLAGPHGDSEPLPAAIAPELPVDSEFIAELKFGECLSEKRQAEMIAARYSVAEAFQQLLAKPLRFIRIAE